MSAIQINGIIFKVLETANKRIKLQWTEANGTIKSRWFITNRPILVEYK